MGNSISNLTRSDTFDASTLIAVSQNGQDYSVLPAPLVTYLDTVLASTSGVIEYSAPQSTGFSATIATTDGSNVWLVLTPAAGYANGIINLPSALNSVTSQEVKVNCTKAVTTLDVVSSGSSVVGHPTTLSANGYFTMKYEPVLKTWYRVG